MKTCSKQDWIFSRSAILRTPTTGFNSTIKTKFRIIENVFIVCSFFHSYFHYNLSIRKSIHGHSIGTLRAISVVVSAKQWPGIYGECCLQHRKQWSQEVPQCYQSRWRCCALQTLLNFRFGSFQALRRGTNEASWL